MPHFAYFWRSPFSAPSTTDGQLPFPSPVLMKRGAGERAIERAKRTNSSCFNRISGPSSKRNTYVTMCTYVSHPREFTSSELIIAYILVVYIGLDIGFSGAVIHIWQTMQAQYNNKNNFYMGGEGGGGVQIRTFKICPRVVDGVNIVADHLSGAEDLVSERVATLSAFTSVANLPLYTCCFPDFRHRSFELILI